MRFIKPRETDVIGWKRCPDRYHLYSSVSGIAWSLESCSFRSRLCRNRHGSRYPAESTSYIISASVRVIPVAVLLEEPLPEQPGGRVHRQKKPGYTQVVDADLQSYLDTIPKTPMLALIEEKVSVRICQAATESDPAPAGKASGYLFSLCRRDNSRCSRSMIIPVSIAADSRSASSCSFGKAG